MAPFSALRLFQNVYIPGCDATGIVTDIDRNTERVKVDYSVRMAGRKRGSEAAAHGSDWFPAAEVMAFSWPVHEPISRPISVHGMHDPKDIAEFTVQQIDALVLILSSSLWRCVEAMQCHLRPGSQVEYEADLACIHAMFLRFYLRLVTVQGIASGLNRGALRRLKETLLFIIVPAQLEMLFGAAESCESRMPQPVVHAILKNSERMPLANRNHQGDRVPLLSADLLADVLMICGYGAGHAEVDAAAKAIVDALAEALAAITGEGRLAAFDASLRSASAGIESCRAHGISSAAIIREATGCALSLGGGTLPPGRGFLPGSGADCSAHFVVSGSA